MKNMKDLNSRQCRVLFYIFSIISGALVIGAVYFAGWGYEQQTTWEPTMSTVVTIQTVHSRGHKGSSTTYRPIYAYRVEGQAYRTPSDHASRPAPHAVGDRVELLYNPENPAEIVENTFWNIYCVSLFFGALGLLFGLFSFLVRRQLHQSLEREMSELQASQTF